MIFFLTDSKSLDITNLLFLTPTSLEASTFIGPCACVPLFLFSGFFIKREALTAGVKWVFNLIFVHYTFNASLISLYGTIDGEERPFLECKEEPELNNITLPDINPNTTIQCESTFQDHKIFALKPLL